MPLKRFMMRITGVNSLLAHYYENLGDRYQTKQNYEKAKAAYIEAIYYDAGGRCKFKLGYCYQLLGEFKSARTWFYNVEDSNYEVEAIEHMGICATSLIDQATALINQAENLQDSDLNSALAKLSAADNLLLDLPSAESTKERSSFLRYKLEWVHEQITFASKLEDAKAIVDIEDRLMALLKINNYLLAYRPYFNSTQLEQFEQSAKVLQETKAAVQQQRNNEQLKEILLKIETGIRYISEGNYDSAAHQLEQATWCYRDLVNAENYEAFIPVEELERARADLLEIERQTNTLKYELPTIITENIAAKLTKVPNANNLVNLHLQEIKAKIRKKIIDMWDKLKPISTEEQAELETELSKIIAENLANAFSTVKDNTCLVFRSSKSCINWGFLNAKLEQYFETFVQTHKRPEIQLEFFKYLQEHGMLEEGNPKKLRLI